MEGSADRVATAIVDCRARGIEVLAPDINRSRADFSIADGRIQFGLAAIKNVGSHAVETIVEMREADGAFKSLEDLCELTSVIQDVNRRVLESLVQSGHSLASPTADALARSWHARSSLDAIGSQARRHAGDGRIDEVAENDYGNVVDVVRWL
jgi:DNA polymerase III alpha subunit